MNIIWSPQAIEDLTSLRAYIAALGGQLSLIAEFPDHEPVVLSGIADESMKFVRPKNRKRAKAHA